jgi:hypothetical protein
VACWYYEQHEELHAFKGTNFILVEMRKGVRPSSRAAGGSVEKRIDCPMPTQTRPTKRMRKDRRWLVVIAAAVFAHRRHRFERETALLASWALV